MEIITFLFHTSTLFILFLLIVFLIFIINNEIRKSRGLISASERLVIRKKVEEEMKAMNKEIAETQNDRLIEINRMAEFGKISKGLFHDLINPFSSLILYVKSLEKNDILSKKDKFALENAIDATERAGKYLDSIKSNLTESDSYKICIVSEEIKSVLDLLSYRIRKNNIKILQNTKNDYVWHGKSIFIQQVFSNIISNSIDAFERNNLSKNNIISINQYEVNSKHYITIENNGPKIPEDIILKVFDPFFSTKERNKGLGIGLSIVKSIIEERLHGKITVENKKMNGKIWVCFTISLPL
jgi:C4-dicarboxylate-specific signal transduction histidine kinase